MQKTTLTYKKTISNISLLILLLMTTFGYSQVLQVKGNNTVIANNDITPSTSDFTDFGTVPHGSQVTKSFILKNTGSSSLTFTASPLVISNTTDFTIITTVLIAKTPTLRTLTPNTYTIIEISYNPTTTSGSQTSTVTINTNNIGDTSYTFTIKGTAAADATPDFSPTTTLLVPNNTFSYPLNITYGPDNYLWVSERGGKKINRVNPSSGAVDVLVDMSSLVYFTGIGNQDGLLGFALYPNIPGTPVTQVYAAYSYGTSKADEKAKIVRYDYAVNGDGTDGTLSNPTDLIVGLSASNDHNSGKLAIGPDNKLYYTIGDQGVNQYDNMCEVNHAQDIPTQTMLNAADYSYYEGKILRLNLDGSIPADNPIIKGVRSHIYSYGHRNAQGLVFGKNGKLYSSEHGPMSDDEINIITSGGNYGWPYIAGFKDDKNYEFCNYSTSTTDCTTLDYNDYKYVYPPGATILTESSWNVPFINPIKSLFTLDAGYNFTGGLYTWPTIAPSSTKLYQGMDNQIPNWDNSLLITSLKGGKIYRQKLSADGNSTVGEPEELLYTANRYRDIAIDPDGKTFYIITDSSGKTSGPTTANPVTVVNPGAILKFTYSPALLACAAPIPTVTNLLAVTDTCPVTLTAPTATNNCSGTIIATTTTTFPITASTTVTWTYRYGNGKTVTQNQTVTINSSSTTWNGTWTNGAPTSTKAVIIAANYAIASDLSACTLTVNNNAAVTVNTGVNLNISGDVTVVPGSSLTFENNVNLLQTKVINGNTGNVTIKRQTSALKFLDYVIWSSPVASQQLQSFSPLTLATRFYTYNSSTDKYNLITSPSTTNFNIGTGYLIRVPNNHPAIATIWQSQFQGIPNNGDFSIAIAQNKYNAIGNPYPSTISANAFIDANGVTEALYFWRKTNNAASTSYATYTKAGGTANTGGGSSQVPNGTIQVGQGFIYKATAVALSFTNAMRISNASNQFLRTTAKTKDSEEKSRIWLNLSKDTEPVNQMMLAYMPGATSGIDPTIDGRYINDNPTALTSLVEDEEFVIQGRSPFENTDLVPLAFKAETGGNYTIQIDHVDGLFSGSQDIILKDNLTGTETDLKANPYTFTAAAGTDNNRFSLKYQKTLGVNIPAVNDSNVVVFKNKGAIHIKSETTSINTVQLFDIKGRLLFKKTNVNAKETTIESSKFENQVLIVKIFTDNKKVESKKIVN